MLCVTTYVLRHGIADRDSLRAGSNGIRSILDVGAGDDGAAGQEQSAADVEVGVWAFFWFIVLVAAEDHTIVQRVCPAEGMYAYVALRANGRRRTVSL